MPNYACNRLHGCRKQATWTTNSIIFVIMIMKMWSNDPSVSVSYTGMFHQKALIHSYCVPFNMTVVIDFGYINLCCFDFGVLL